MKAPWWSRKVLSLLVPKDRRDDVLGDLEEVHGRRLERLAGTSGRSFAAWLLTSAETFSLMGAFLVYRFREKDWALPWLSASDVRIGLRLMKKQPMLAATAIVALGLGVAVATTGFSIVDSIVNGELPFSNGDRFVKLGSRSVSSGYVRPLELEHFHLLKRETTSFEHLGALSYGEVAILHGADQVESVDGAWITPASFRHLPYTPVLGRTLLPADGASDAAPVAVIRESLWHRSYGGEGKVLGQVIRVEGKDYEVVGVLADDAGFPAAGELWLPLDDRYLGGSADAALPYLDHFGILQEGVNLEAAAAEVAALSQRYVPSSISLTEDVEASRTVVLPYIEVRPEEVWGAVAMMIAFVMLLLVIAANVANLILARTSARSGEFALRSALGAGRSRLLGQLMVEALLLGGTAAAFGLVMAHYAGQWLESHVTEAPFWLDLSPNFRTLAFVVVITLLISLVGGVLPALKATRSRFGSELQGGALQGGAGGQSAFGFGRTGSTMIIAEIALSVVMLSGSLVISQGLSDQMNRELGLPREQILTAKVYDESSRASKEASPTAAQHPLADQVVAAAASLPGAVAAGLGNSLPRQDAGDQRIVVAPEAGEAMEPSRTTLAARVRPGFLEALDAKAIDGRLFRSSDLQPGAAPVTIVNEPFVREFLGNRNPIGRRIRTVGNETAGGGTPSGEVWREIVGVVPDLGLSSADPQRTAGFYVPWSGSPRHFFLVIRSQGDAELLAGPLRQALIDLDPQLRVSEVLPLEQVDTARRSLLSGLVSTLVALGAMVLLLSLASLYAMISFAVTRRTREIGIRVALGAGRWQVLKTIGGTAGMYLLWGGSLGALCVWTADLLHLLDKILGMRLPRSEVWILPLVLLLFFVAAISASWVPARKALGIQPSDALRFD